MSKLTILCLMLLSGCASLRYDDVDLEEYEINSLEQSFKDNVAEKPTTKYGMYKESSISKNEFTKMLNQIEAFMKEPDVLNFDLATTENSETKEDTNFLKNLDKEVCKSSSYYYCLFYFSGENMWREYAAE